ncbi:MAG: hypothetical protein IT161_07170 [Bryobacterales bacterium]|nr:hypothetical protein [Bryobacterales bacterium]MCZ2157584.1 terminase family protein [Bryobacterales bacterium]
MDRTETRLRVDRAILYKPLPSQKLFHESTSRFKGFSGPVGSGKSQALCNEAIRLAYLNPGRTGLVGAPTYPMLRDATLTSLTEVLNESAIPFELNKAENVIELLDTGSRILLRSLEEYERLRGTNLAWFGVDELTYTHGEAWQRLEGRLRDPKASVLRGFAVWTPKGFDWVYRRFIAAPVDGYECIKAKAFENRHLLDRIPDYYERLKRSYDQEFYEQEVLGAYLAYQTGLVYRAFDRSRNVEKLRIDRSKRLYWALDFNVEPMASVVAQVDGDQVNVIEEIFLSRASTREVCEEFGRRYPSWPAGVTVYGDASANQRSIPEGKSSREYIEDFFRHGPYRASQVRFPRSNPAVRDRVGLMNAKLRNADGDVSLRIHEGCVELIADFEQVTYRKGSAEIDKTSNPNRTHVSDALGYLIWQEFGTRPATIGERPRGLF